MKTANLNILLLCFLLVTSVTAYTQNSTIDSLTSVLQTQKEDTNKVNTLNALCEKYMNVVIDTAFDYSENALALAKKINYSNGEEIALFNMGKIYSRQNMADEATQSKRR